MPVRARYSPRNPWMPADGHYRCGGIAATRDLCGWPGCCGKSPGTGHLVLANLNFYGLRFCVPGGVFDGEGVGGVLCGRDVDAAGVGGPDRTRLRLELDGLGIGNAVAELGFLAAVDGAGNGVEGLNGQLFAAKLVEGGAIIFKLRLGPLLRDFSFDLAIFLPAGEEDPGDNESSDREGD